MTSPLTAKTTYPKKDFTTITQTGLKALNLALTHHTDIDPRLPPGTTDGLSDDLDALGVVIPGARQARHEAQSATAAQNAMLVQGYARLRAIRTAVRKSRAPKDVQRAYGVGQQVSPDRVRDVKAALQQIIDRALSDPDEAAGLGILPADVAALKDARSAITSADATQEQKRASAPLSTKERNQTANRILLATARIAGAGMIAFSQSPAELASFEALVMSSGSKKSAGAKAKKEPDAPAEPASPPP